MGTNTHLSLNSWSISCTMTSSALVVCRRMASFTEMLKANVSLGADCSLSSGALPLFGSTVNSAGGSGSVSGVSGAGSGLSGSSDGLPSGLNQSAGLGWSSYGITGSLLRRDWSCSARSLSRAHTVGVNRHGLNRGFGYDSCVVEQEYP